MGTKKLLLRLNGYLAADLVLLAVAVIGRARHAPGILLIPCWGVFIAIMVCAARDIIRFWPRS